MIQIEQIVVGLIESVLKKELMGMTAMLSMLGVVLYELLLPSYFHVFYCKKNHHRRDEGIK